MPSDKALKRIIPLKKDITQLKKAVKIAMEPDSVEYQDTVSEIELEDLKHMVKELIYRIQEKGDVRNDFIFKELKRELGVY